MSVWISCLADAHDASALDSDIGLDDTRVVDDESISDDHVQGCFLGDTSGLSHAITEDLATAELAFVTINRMVFATSIGEPPPRAMILS